MSSSGEDASGSDTDDTDDEDEEAAEERRRKEEEEEWGVGVMAANPEEPIPLIDETNRWVAQVALRRTMEIYIIYNIYSGGTIANPRIITRAQSVATL